MAPHRPDKPYTTQLQAGLGLVAETKLLLELWSPGQSAAALARAALASGRFPTVSARRLNNIVRECFGPRYLTIEKVITYDSAQERRLKAEISE